MLRLSVTSRIHDNVIDHQVVNVVDDVWVGDLAAAAISFPGAVFRIAEAEVGVQVHGLEKPITLLPGGNLIIDLSDRVDGFEIELVVVRRASLARDRWAFGDVRLLVLTGAIVLFGMWMDTVNRWVRTSPEIAAEIEALPALWTRSSPEVEEPPQQPSHRTPEVTYRD